VIAGIVVTLPFCSSPVCLPVMFRLVTKGTNSASRLWLARRMAEALAGAPPGRAIRVVADAAYAGKELRGLNAAITWTNRLRKDAALYELAPPRTGRRGRSRVRGARLPALAAIAAAAEFTPVTMTRYRKTATVRAAALTCLWHTVFGAQQARVILIRDTAARSFALVTTDLHATPAQVVERYAARWSIEVAIEDAKQVLGAGQARNRVASAVRRTGEYSRKVPQPAWIWEDWYGRPETLACTYVLLWMCCLLMACKRSGSSNLRSSTGQRTQFEILSPGARVKYSSRVPQPRSPELPYTCSDQAPVPVTDADAARC
jgi:hypothetical protein